MSLTLFKLNTHMHCLSSLPMARSDLWVHPEIQCSSASCIYPIHSPSWEYWEAALARDEGETPALVKMLRCLCIFQHPRGSWNTDKAWAVSKRPQLAKTAADFICLMTGAFRERAEHFAEHRSIFTCVYPLQTSLYEQAKQKWVHLSEKTHRENRASIFSQ